MRRPRRSTVDEYVGTRCDDIHKLTGSVLRLRAQPIAAEVVITARVQFGQHGLLDVWEVVRSAAGAAFRHRYGYEALYGEEFLFRYDLDPRHQDMPNHKHLPPEGKRRVACSDLGLRAIGDELWEAVAKREAS
jgi:hypothetical protein